MNLPDLIMNNIVLSVLSLLLAGFLAGLATYKFLLGFPYWNNKIYRKNETLINAIDLVDSSSLPIYIADKDLKIIHCNDAYLRFFSTERDEVVNRLVGDLARESKALVHNSDLARYDKEQKALEKRAKLGNLPEADAHYVFDMRSHPSPNYQNLYNVSIHFDKIYSKKDRKFLASLGIFFTQKK